MVCHPCKVAGYFDCADSGIHAASSFALVVSDPWGLLSDNMPVAEAAIRHSAINGTRHMSPIRDVNRMVNTPMVIRNRRERRPFP